MEITVLGPGCANCQRLEANVNAALEAAGTQATVTHVTDYAQIAAWDVMSTPGLAVNGRVVSTGRVPSVAEVAELIASA